MKTPRDHLQRFKPSWEAEAMRQAEQLCRTTKLSFKVIAATTKVPDSSFRKRSREGGWRPRRGGKAAGTESGPTVDARARLKLIARLGAAGARLLGPNQARLKNELGLAEREREARLLAQVCKTIKNADALRTQPARAPHEDAHGSGEPRRSLAELRDELYRHLVRIRRERGLDGIPRELELGGLDEPSESLAAPLPQTAGTAGL
jgi:hypothetical protein